MSMTGDFNFANFITDKVGALQVSPVHLAGNATGAWWNCNLLVAVGVVEPGL